MKPEQKIIADWMSRTMAARGWNPQQWATEAGVYPTTVSRATSPTFDSVTSIPTLHALAKAAKVPTVLDFIADDLPTPEPPPAPSINAETLSPLLSALLPLVPKGRLSESDAALIAEVLVYGLGLLPADPSSPASEDAIGVAARAAAVRFRDLFERS